MISFFSSIISPSYLLLLSVSLSLPVFSGSDTTSDSDSDSENVRPGYIYDLLLQGYAKHELPPNTPIPVSIGQFNFPQYLVIPSYTSYRVVIPPYTSNMTENITKFVYQLLPY